jgi:hypothetical protein
LEKELGQSWSALRPEPMPMTFKLLGSALFSFGQPYAIRDGDMGRA